MKLLSFLLAVSVFTQSCAKNYDYDFSAGSGISKYPIDWGKAADSSTTFLINNYWNANPGYFNTNNNGNTGFGYWPQAHALDVLLDAYGRTRSSAYLSYMAQWLTGVKQKNGNTFLNNFYDDEGWNGLAMLRGFDSTQNQDFKNAVMDIWTDIKGGWSPLGGGGIAWSKTTLAFKNTPANGPACILAARLYQDFKNPDDLAWASKIYKWLKDSMMNAVTGAVIDGLQADKGTRVTNMFTYNQGLMIGAGLEMFKITADPTYLNDAIKVADNALNSSAITTADRLLVGEGQGDGGLFKGVFVRYFTRLIMNPSLPADVQKRYLNFLKYNAETLWYRGTNKQTGAFGSYWNTAPATGIVTDVTTEESGCMLIEAAALLKKAGYF